MSVETPKPIEDVEKKVADAVPPAVRPEVEAVESEANKVFDQAAAGGPEAGAAAAVKDPGVAAAAKDIGAILSGHAESPSALITTGEAVVKEVKAGYKTTEFWITVAIIVLSQVGALNIPGKYGETITTSAAAASYVISRGLAK